MSFYDQCIIINLNKLLANLDTTPMGISFTIGETLCFSSIPVLVMVSFEVQ